MVLPFGLGNFLVHFGNLCLLWMCLLCPMGFPGGSDSKESVCNEGDLGLIPGFGGSPGEGNGYPLQYSCLKNPMDEEPGRLQSMRSQRVGHNWVTNTFTSLCPKAKFVRAVCNILLWSFLRHVDLCWVALFQDIKKRWQEYTEELYKKDFHNPDNHNGVITDL